MIQARYQFRPATLDDLPMLRQWIEQAEVSQWWGNGDPYDAADLESPHERFMIVRHEDEPFAFMQDYDVHSFEGHHFGHLPPGSRGIDQFIGLPGKLGQGHGSAFVRERVEEFFAAGAPAVATDPQPDNERAIAAYKKAGFIITGDPIETEWGLVLPMVARP